MTTRPGPVADSRIFRGLRPRICPPAGRRLHWPHPPPSATGARHVGGLPKPLDQRNWYYEEASCGSANRSPRANGGEPYLSRLIRPAALSAHG